MNNTLKNRLKYHVSGAIERGEAQAIVEKTTLHKGPFPLQITKNDECFVVLTNQRTHYAKTFDPSAARLIASAPDLLDLLETAVARVQIANEEGDPILSAWLSDALSTLRKAKGEA